MSHPGERDVPFWCQTRNSLMFADDTRIYITPPPGHHNPIMDLSKNIEEICVQISHNSLQLIKDKSKREGRIRRYRSAPVDKSGTGRSSEESVCGHGLQTYGRTLVCVHAGLRTGCYTRLHVHYVAFQSCRATTLTSRMRV